MSTRDQTWTVKAILDWCEGYLASKGDANPRLSAQWLLGEAMGLSRIELYTNLDKPLSEEERSTMRAWVQRRGTGEPLQLICGTAPFRHMVLEVAPGVLIPRPETEVLVSEVLALFPAPKQVSAYAFEDEVATPEVDDGVKVVEVGEEIEAEGVAESEQSVEEAEEAPEPIRVIDLCTGSGCIACALATEHPNMEVLALDIAPEALVLAKRNVEAQGVAERVTVVESDLLSVVVADPANRGAFDAIVSNPPYIPSAVVDTLDAEVSDYEPRLALDGGQDGLDLFRRFIVDAHILLKPGGVLAAELFEDSLEEAAQIAESNGFTSPRIVNDLANKRRILLATRL
ncbi:N5-glutamine methyltransferase family protein [Anaerotardibacter muris]|uniref:N5-glutamine methyltransferase family protein n=1 Tax=Anaerotardibacter muris TaxID=2941505 RepID=UPI00203D1089|nr:HemK/PrmC family methyltransferase [Anaerotardibacter muris]